MNRIPVVILSGFLGSGKTTLLLKLLTETKKYDFNYAVLINERGKVDVDGLLVSKSFDSEKIDSLLDGCICCSKKSEITQSIDALLQKKPDVIFIELTGVANPEEVANTLNEREIIAKVELKSIITVLDAEFLLDAHSHAFKDTLYYQLECANHVVINKMDLVRESAGDEIKKIIKKRNSAAEIEFAQFGDIDFEKLLKHIFSTNNVKQHSPDKGNSMQKNYSSMTTLVLPADRSLTKAAVKGFLTRHADKIVRAKGFVQILEEGKTTSNLFQYSGVRRMEWKSESSDQYFLILIGIDLDSGTLKSEWLKTIGAQPEFV
ncbi:CobW family GTP-binding protein [Neobacillus sp. NPDC097160]|uniref:CobW family GTP-binding protein n=1 Tax=Neobacillus sp. NPDC097160 TaxID=3364298 RepID=UPI0037FC6D29